jgi:hypothetical protein
MPDGTLHEVRPRFVINYSGFIISTHKDDQIRRKHLETVVKILFENNVKKTNPKYCSS